MYSPLRTRKRPYDTCGGDYAHTCKHCAYAQAQFQICISKQINSIDTGNLRYMLQHIKASSSANEMAAEKWFRMRCSNKYTVTVTVTVVYASTHESILKCKSDGS